MADIKNKIREIELSYDYNHLKEDYDVVVNLTEICTLFESVLAEERNNAINEFAERLKSDEFQKYNLDMVFETSRDLSYSHCINAFHEYVDEIAEQMKGGAE